MAMLGVGKTTAHRKAATKQGECGGDALDLGSQCVEALLRLNCVGVAIFDAPLRRALRFNDYFQAIVGYGRNELARRTWQDLCHPDDRKNCERALASLDERRPHARVSFRMLRKDGCPVRVDGDLRFARHGPGGAGHFVAVLSDASEFRQAHAGWRDAEEKLRAVSEQTIAGFYVIEKGRFTYVNSRMAEIFDLRADEMTGMRVHEVVAREDRRRVQENIRLHVAGEAESLKYEFRGVRRGGTRVDVGVHGTAVNISGRRAIVGVAQDISAQVTANQRIQDYVRQLEATTLGTARAMSHVAALRDPYTAGHARRVADISTEVARVLGMQEASVRGLHMAGMLHDIGKIGVPAEILSRPSRLSAVEFELVKLHTNHGREILRGIEFPWPVAEVASQHHERMDGSGYPEQLHGEAIIPEARVLAVADVIEAMASHRPYRPAIGVGPALEELERGAGRLYDADVVRAAVRLFRDLRYRLPT